MTDRKIKREGKEKQMIEKLGQDKYHWSYNVQTQPLPSWIEAFDYAYKLGIKDLQDRLYVLRRYHGGDGTVTREDVMKALSDEG